MNILLQGTKSRPGWLVAGLLILVLFGLLTAQGCSPSAQKVSGQSEVSPPGELLPSPRVGRLAPDFTLTDLEGNSVTLSDFRGKVVFINFWATWCPPCRAEMPEIETVHREYKSQDVVVIGVNILETEDEVRQFVQAGGYSWNFVLDTTGVVTTDYGITAIPTSFFLDKKGVIQAVKVGAMTKREMESLLAKTMK